MTRARASLRWLLLGVAVSAFAAHGEEDCVVWVPVAVAPPLVVSPSPAIAVSTPADPEPAEPRLVLKLLGGSSAAVHSSATNNDRGASGLLGGEFLLADWLTLRSDVVLRSNGVSWDVLGLKLRVPWRLAPYVSASASVGLSGWRLAVGPVGAAGFDLRLGRFVLVVEGAYRVAPSDTLRRAGQVSWMLGLGYTFF